MAQNALLTLAEAIMNGNLEDVVTNITAGEPEFKDDNGFYVFLWEANSDEEAQCVAHAGNPTLVGQSMSSLNLNATLFINAAKKNGDWVQYLWPSAEDSSKNVEKYSWVLGASVPTPTGELKTYFLGVGFQVDKLTDETACSPAYFTGCSIRSAFDLANSAKMALDNTFDASVQGINEKAEAFKTEAGFYVFLWEILSDNSTKCTAHAANSDLVGKAGKDYIDEQLFVDAASKSGGWVHYTWEGTDKFSWILPVQNAEKKYFVGVGFNVPSCSGSCDAGACTCGKPDLSSAVSGLGCAGMALLLPFPLSMMDVAFAADSPGQTVNCFCTD